VALAKCLWLDQRLFISNRQGNRIQPLPQPGTLSTTNRIFHRLEVTVHTPGVGRADFGIWVWIKWRYLVKGNIGLKCLKGP